MLKVAICLACSVLLALAVLQLRRQRLELIYETAELHDQIRSQQARLWSQQLQIASCTAPNAIDQTIDAHGLKLVPEFRPKGMEPEQRPPAPTHTSRSTVGPRR